MINLKFVNNFSAVVGQNSWYNNGDSDNHDDPD